MQAIPKNKGAQQEEANKLHQIREILSDLNDLGEEPVSKKMQPVICLSDSEFKNDP